MIKLYFENISGEIPVSMKQSLLPWKIGTMLLPTLKQSITLNDQDYHHYVCEQHMTFFSEHMKQR